MDSKQIASRVTKLNDTLTPLWAKLHAIDNQDLQQQLTVLRTIKDVFKRHNQN